MLNAGYKVQSRYTRTHTHTQSTEHNSRERRMEAFSFLFDASGKGQMEKGKVFYGNTKASKVAQSGKEHICWQKEALLSYGQV